ncbi:MAG: Glycosyl transferase, group 2 family protein [uncultured Thiotrichaceae bacterium]|uniref:Glycosyl transferase, group 2 family protein n=1 Tax=uncultured Thiotrichaceae bacterium TaxID=298394 RepID=A0A6S6SHT5_9GAMM|nr:MAG: Glycosyl transferase, group 2 family protein [uncultured Thiotrichaceae bacterium]
MIVKNESAVIERCLESVAKYIDYWVICDTGSTDGTQQKVQHFFDVKNIPGELFEDEWQDFAHNRNLALERAKKKAGYILIIDADDYLETSPNFQFAALKADAYNLRVQLNELVYFNTKLIRSDVAWEWRGVLHEFLFAEKVKPFVNYYGDYVMKATRDGDRSQDPEKYKHDIKVLEAALEKEPGHTRYQFYLAQTYRDLFEYDKAIEHYSKRVAMGGWGEEVYVSMLEVARCLRKQGKPVDQIIEAYLKAYRFRPQRFEGLFEMLKLCRITGRFFLGYQLCKDIKGGVLPKDILFVENAVYEWMYHDELAVCAINAHDFRMGASLLKRLLNKKVVPHHEVERMRSNLQFAESKLETQRKRPKRRKKGKRVSA